LSGAEEIPTILVWGAGVAMSYSHQYYKRPFLQNTRKLYTVDRALSVQYNT
jgi:hypothetical protein